MKSCGMYAGNQLKVHAIATHKVTIDSNVIFGEDENHCGIKSMQVH